MLVCEGWGGAGRAVGLGRARGAEGGAGWLIEESEAGVWDEESEARVAGSAMLGGYLPFLKSHKSAGVEA